MLDGRKPYQIEITYGFAALEKVRVDEDTNRDGKNIKELNKTSARECLDLQ